MTPNRIAVLVASLFTAAATGALAHGDDPKTRQEGLGKSRVRPEIKRKFLGSEASGRRGFEKARAINDPLGGFKGRGQRPDMSPQHRLDLAGDQVPLVLPCANLGHEGRERNRGKQTDHRHESMAGLIESTRRKPVPNREKTEGQAGQNKTAERDFRR